MLAHHKTLHDTPCLGTDGLVPYIAKMLARFIGRNYGTDAGIPVRTERRVHVGTLSDLVTAEVRRSRTVCSGR